MPKYDAAIPRDERLFVVTLAFVHEYDGASDQNSLAFLNRVRAYTAKTAATKLQQKYNQELALNKLRFQSLLKSLNADVLVGVPSDRPYMRTFLAEARKVFPKATELTKFFRKKPGFACGQAKTVSACTKGLSFELPENFKMPTGPLLIVDDVVADGVTAASILTMLAEAGYLLDAGVAVAAPLAGSQYGAIPPVEPAD